MELKFPLTNESQDGNHAENQENLNVVHINQIDRDINVDLGIIKSNNQISASKILIRNIVNVSKARFIYERN